MLNQHGNSLAKEKRSSRAFISLDCFVVTMLSAVRAKWRTAKLTASKFQS